MSFFSRLSIAVLAASLPMLAGSAPGISNFDQVDAHVYRGGQPSDQGFQYLAKIGVKTVIDLRESGSRSREEQQAVTRNGMHYVNVPMTGLIPPSSAEIAKILGLLEDSSTGAVFVHCRRGADRTGAVIAAYHIDHDRWDNVHALRDAKDHRMSVFQLPRQAFIRDFQARTVEAKATMPATAVSTTNTTASITVPAAAGPVATATANQ